MDMDTARDILKTVYGCSQVRHFLPHYRRPDHAKTRDGLRTGRALCAGKLAEARKRGDVWAIGVHKSHLVGFDRDLLAA